MKDECALVRILGKSRYIYRICFIGASFKCPETARDKIIILQPKDRQLFIAYVYRVLLFTL